MNARCRSPCPHGACQGRARGPCPFPAEALPAAGRMPREAGMGFHGGTRAPGHGLHGATWAKPCFWSYPRDFSTSVSPVMALWFSSALQGLQKGSMGTEAHGAQLPLLWGGRGHSGSPRCAGQDKALLSLTCLLLPLPTPGRSALEGNLPQKWLQLLFHLCNIWNVLPGWKTTYLVRFIA